MRNILLAAGTILPVVGTAVYIAAIVRGQVKPQRMTRLLMLVIGVLSFGALFSAHDTSAVWLALVSLVQAAVLWIVALKRGVGGADKLDIVCFAVCILGLGLWLWSGQSLFGLSMSILADLVACLPALRKTFRLPYTELAMFYALDVIAGTCILLAGKFTLMAMLYPIYIAVVNGVFAGIIWWPRRSDISHRQPSPQSDIIEP